ncbi:synapsin-1-like [Pithys albifrons albifrons]|uniref:synapsin-1-like n=1 Tax=Pithys albifrons albifrons TaxID=3385563 RepID=UPI003A5CE8B8
MQTPVNSSETKTVISETLERDPSFLHQLTKQPYVPSRDTRSKPLRGRRRRKKKKKKKRQVRNEAATPAPRHSPSCLSPEAAVQREADPGAQGCPVTTPQEGILPSPWQPGAGPGADRHQRLGSRFSSSSLPTSVPPAAAALPDPRLSYTTGPRRRLMLPSASAPRQGGWEAEHGEAWPPVGERSVPGVVPACTMLAARLSAARTPPRRRLSPTARGGAGPPPASRPRRAPALRCGPEATGGTRPLPPPRTRQRRLSLHASSGTSIQVSPRQPDPGPAAATTSSFSGGGGNHRSAGCPPARPREEPARDGTTQARTLRRPRRPLGHFPARGQQVPGTSRPGPGHWSAATALTPLHRRLQRRVPELQLRSCRRFPLSPRRPRPTLRRAASGVCRQPRAAAAAPSCPAAAA